ncbi:hypothetical protein ABIC08_007740 [Bradyrhizobium sp. RT9b]|uniref:hypothetical protein n=1 Tax=unclassified Bradyrhizobium TaxID=2631580 RepID=UPI0033958483
MRDLRNQVAKLRKIYEDCYRDVRYMVFAHERRDATVEAVLARTNIEELKDFFGSLSGLYAALHQLHINGREPVVQILKVTLPPNGRSGLSPGERVYAEGHEVLRRVSLPDPEEERYNAGIFT